MATGRSKESNAAAGASAAGMRALSAQFASFYFRIPVKAFLRSRLDYMAYARAINPTLQSSSSWSWESTSPGILISSIRKHGWSFIPKQVLPPMFANATVGAVLYTTYLQSLGALHEPSSHHVKRVYLPPPPSATFQAGWIAGAIQSLVSDVRLRVFSVIGIEGRTVDMYQIAAPLDALQVRFNAAETLRGGRQFDNMFQYANFKLREIGPRGIFAGWSLSFLKDSFGYGFFFATFETIKGQAYYNFLTTYYGYFKPITRFEWPIFPGELQSSSRPVIRPHYALEPIFILFAGIVASVSQQLIWHPISAVQNVYWTHVESLDHAARTNRSRWHMLRLYYRAYQTTYQQCASLAAQVGGWKHWLFRGFMWNTLRQAPSTSVGLVVFEIIRRKYGTADNVLIRKDGFDILL